MQNFSLFKLTKLYRKTRIEERGIMCVWHFAVMYGVVYVLGLWSYEIRKSVAKKLSVRGFSICFNKPGKINEVSNLRDLRW